MALISTAVLYGQNEFLFVLGGPNEYVPSPQMMFGRFSPSSVREMNYISLVFSTSASEPADLDVFSYRLRAYVRHFAHLLNEGYDDPARRSLLQSLLVDADDEPSRPSLNHRNVQSARNLPHVLAFEELIHLQPIKEFYIVEDARIPK